MDEISTISLVGCADCGAVMSWDAVKGYWVCPDPDCGNIKFPPPYPPAV